VQPEDPQALADAIDLLMSDPGLRRQLGDAARARVVDRYPLQCSLDGTLSLWRKLGAVPAIDHRRVPVPGMSAERPGYVG
jgi:glycosyltransferase involved in cell wall biosynthesis